MAKDICKACGANQSDYADKTIDVNGTERVFTYDVDDKSWVYSDGGFTYTLKKEETCCWVFSYHDESLFREEESIESSSHTSIAGAIKEVVTELSDHFRLYAEALGYDVTD